MAYFGLLAFVVSIILLGCLLPWYWKVCDRIRNRLPEAIWVQAPFFFLRYLTLGGWAGLVLGFNIKYFGSLNVQLWGDLHLFHVLLVPSVFISIWLAKKIVHHFNTRPGRKRR